MINLRYANNKRITLLCPTLRAKLQWYICLKTKTTRLYFASLCLPSIVVTETQGCVQVFDINAALYTQ